MPVKRLQILMDEELDAELQRLAARQRRSKSALIREFVRERVKPLPPLEEDPIWQMVGVDNYEPADVDQVVYLDEIDREMGRLPAKPRKRPRRR